MKNKLMKIISLILCTLLLTPLFACDNTGDDGNNPPNQTNFYEEILTISSPKFYCYEQFDNIEDATAYAKTWREDYELFIPEIEEADSLRIDFITYQSGEEKEIFSHKIEFEYVNADPFYVLKGNTTVFNAGQIDKSKLYIETKTGYVSEERKNITEYFYNENGYVGYTGVKFEEMTYPYGIKYENFVISNGALYIKKEETKTLKEIKALTLDNIVPIEEQKYKDKEISTKFDLEIDVLIGGQTYIYQNSENVYELEKDVKNICEYTKEFAYLIRLEENEYINKITNQIQIYFSKAYYRISQYPFDSYFHTNTCKIEMLNEAGEKVKIKLSNLPANISLLNEQDEKMFEYKLEIDKEKDNGFYIKIKNGYGIIFYGTITAEDKTTINLEEIEQKILSKIVLIKGD